MRYFRLIFAFIFFASSAHTAHAKSNKTWLALKIENPGSLTKDQVNLIQMNMISLDKLPPMFYTAVARFDMETGEITKPAKLFELPMHHDGYIFLKVKPSAYIFTQEGQIDTHKICYKNYNKVFVPIEGAINFLGTIDRNLIIKNVEKFSMQNIQTDTSLTPTVPSKNDIETLKQFMQGNKKVSRIKGDIISLKAQNVDAAAFSSKSLKKLNCR